MDKFNPYKTASNQKADADATALFETLTPALQLARFALAASFAEAAQQHLERGDADSAMAATRSALHMLTKAK